MMVFCLCTGDDDAVLPVNLQVIMMMCTGDNDVVLLVYR